MALASPTAVSAAMNALDALMTHVSLHSATTGTTGAAEFSGGGYARQACSWNASAAGSAKTNSSALTFTTSGATPVTHLGTFNASSAGTFAMGYVLGSPVTAASITVAAGAISLSAT